MRCRKLMMGLVLAVALSTLAVGAPPTGAVSRPWADGSRPGSHGAADGSRSEGHETGERTRGAGRAAGVSTFRGWAFDTCLAPPVGTMRRWKASDYQAVGVYYGGRGRACDRQPELTAGWMRKVRGLGWKVLPVYVGSQSPCVTAKHKKDVRMGKHPWKQGTKEGRDAVKKAKALGMRGLSPLYLDMEAYAHRKKKCAKTTLSFVRAWDREVRRLGYVPGFYSSASSGVRHMEAARRAGVRDLPAVMWFARWHTRPHLYREPALARGAWHPERRIHQYAGNVKERHGGRTLMIDRNLVHAPVARIG
ncbi:glycoside hydrolase domain-containing protein [Streptomyces sp. SYP-A7185]|uniref:glycoside hydrolase domain-containing protein n=1 Tax=Streptomyces sp. SYP-A7185 TaxID=3040076 RepID=UPI0038F650B2